MSAPTSPVEIEEHTSHGIAYVDLASLHPASATSSTQMLVTTVDGARCPAPIDFTFRYTADPYGQRNFTRSMHVDLSRPGGKTTKLFFPAYFMNSADNGHVSFVGLEVAEHQRHCVRFDLTAFRAGCLPRVADDDTARRLADAVAVPAH